MEPKYIVFDGMDGSGKGTQIELLRKKFPGDRAVVFTREPGGTPFAEKIRTLVRDDPLAGQTTALAQALLFLAAREELRYSLVAPALADGRHVFSDRGDSSTFAFQLCGEERKDELMDLFVLTRKLILPEPDMYIVFDLPADVARTRALRDAKRNPNHFDVRDLAYYERVREGFRDFARLASVEFVNALRTPEEIHGEVMAILYTIGIAL